MRSISQTFRCFDEVARRGSIRKAADALHLTAAAVHQQIRNLEEQVGVPLFDRLPRGMQLTLAGEIVIAAVRRGQRDFDALTQVEDLRALRRGHVNLAVPASTAERLVPDAILAAMQRYPASRTACARETARASCAGSRQARPTSAMRCARRRASSRCARSHSRWASSRRPAIRSRRPAAGAAARLFRASADPDDARHGAARDVRPDRCAAAAQRAAADRDAGADGAAPRGRRCGCRLPDRRERRGRRGRRPARVDAACRCGARSFSCIYQRADMSATVAMTMFLEFFSRRSKRWRADSRAPAAQPASADGSKVTPSAARAHRTAMQCNTRTRA